jgi:hypothetical protein
VSASQEIPRIALNKAFHYRHNSLSKPGINLRDFVVVKLPVLFPEYIRTTAGTNFSLMATIKAYRVYRELHRFICWYLTTVRSFPDKISNTPGTLNLQNCTICK